jgi:hypothetical protein
MQTKATKLYILYTNIVVEFFMIPFVFWIWVMMVVL